MLLTNGKPLFGAGMNRFLGSTSSTLAPHTLRRSFISGRLWMPLAPTPITVRPFILAIKDGGLWANNTSISNVLASMFGVGNVNATNTATSNVLGQVIGVKAGLSTIYGTSSLTYTTPTYNALARMSCKIDIGAQPTASDVADAVWARNGALNTLELIRKLLQNKVITNPATGKQDIFDDDNTTLLLQANLFEDAAGTTPYSGNGANRRDRLT